MATMMNQIGFITPPFGLNLFVAMKVGNAGMKEVFMGSWQFLICMAVVTVLIILVPQISTILPDLMGL